ncbi:PadR family transcriptional regulator [Anaerosporobacter sp.]
MLEYIVLGIINYEDMTGYDIKKYMECGICVFYKASFGSLYPILKKLTKKGLVTMYESNNGGRNKNYYCITEEGKKIFEDWLETPITIDDGKGTQLVKIYFYDLLQEEKCRELLLKYRENNEKYLNELYELEKQYVTTRNKDCYYYKLSVLDYGIRVIQETIRWCDDIINRREL